MSPFLISRTEDDVFHSIIFISLDWILILVFTPSEIKVRSVAQKSMLITIELSFSSDSFSSYVRIGSRGLGAGP